MKPMRALFIAIACLQGNVAAAGDALDVRGMLDVRWIQASRETSYLDGGLGKLRFDSNHEDFRLGRAFLDSRVRLTDTVTLHSVIDAYGDHDRNFIDASELWAEFRPFPTSALRWRVRVGAYYAPLSFENRGPGWSSVYSMTPSALNTWIGEEFRTIGAEVEARWLGASTQYLGDFAIVASVYGWNDPAGVLIANRGFALSDRPSTLFGSLGRPPIEFYHEIDNKPGYYAGISWRHHDRLELRALRYDNKGDPGAFTKAGGGAWLTRFSSFGARLEPDAHWTFIAQYLDGITVIGADADADDQFRMSYHAAFALASFERGRDRWTVRFDRFGTHQSNGFFGQPSDDAGHAWTAAWTHDFGEHWQAVGEWVGLHSRFAPRINLGESPSGSQTQTQLALRYRFHVTR